MLKTFFTLLLATLLSITTNADTINLTEDNHVTLRSEVDDYSISKLSLELAAAVAKRGSKTYTIYLVLDSPGGSIDAGLAFIEFAKTVKNLETITLFSASMAAGIAQALPGKRHIIDSGVFMFHRARGGVEGQFESGELESRLSFYKQIVLSMEQKNADRMKMSIANYKDKVKDELWILGSSAVKLNAADSLVDVTCSKELTSKSTNETFSIMGLFSITVSFNNCPLIRGGQVQGDSRAQALYKNYRKEKYGIFNK